MVRRYSLASALVFFCIVLGAVSASAHWLKNGTPVCNVFRPNYNARIMADQNGGAIITWESIRMGSTDIVGTRIDSDGNDLGPPEGVPVCTFYSEKLDYNIIPDGTGGAIVAWRDFRNGGSSDIYAQRVDGTGTVRWAPDGIGICTGGFNAGQPNIISDGGTGAIIVWSDVRNGMYYDIYAQRVDADGNALWAPNGVVVCTQPSNKGGFVVVPDGSGGAIIVWQDYRVPDSDIYAQRIDPDGNLLWAPDGAPICTSSDPQENAQIASVSGGAVIVWQDPTGVYAQRIDMDGNPLWAVNGIPVCPGGSGEHWPQVVADLNGGAIVAWNESWNSSWAVYAQRLGSNGDLLWGYYGARVLPFAAANYLNMISDGEGGAIVSLDTNYGQTVPWTDIYAQRIDSTGTLLWVPGGVTVCNAPFDQTTPVVASDGRGGAIIAWGDNRYGNGDYDSSDVYCQRIRGDGLWGDPKPDVVSCLDLRPDQGGWMRLVTRASSHDIASEKDYPILGYSVWRRIGPSGGKTSSPRGLAASAAERAKLLGLFASPSKLKGVKLSGGQAQLLGFPPGDWESVASQSSTQDTLYRIAAPTRNDSTSSGTPWEVYVVTAHTSFAGLFATSAPDSGYSVDNLAPGATGGFAGVQSISPPGLKLTWMQNNAPDLSKYNVHRGDDASFVPDGTNIVGTTTETTLMDASWNPNMRKFYKLLAIDKHGNASPEALLTPDNIKVGTELQGFTASLVQSWIEVSWTLSEVSPDMKFSVLRADASGGTFEEVSSAEIANEGRTFTCKDRSCEPGTSYKYRIDAADASGRWTLFETSAITTPAMPLTLYQNHPNPFNPSTVISYYMPDGGQVTLDVYDSSGRLVTRLLDREKQAKGTHSVEWHGIDAQGRAVSSGVYFYRFLNGKETISKKMVLLR